MLYAYFVIYVLIIRLIFEKRLRVKSKSCRADKVI